MASSKVMATTSITNSDVPAQPSLCPSLSTLITDLQNHNQAHSCDPSSMNMDDLLKTIYSASSPPHDHLPHSHAPFSGASQTRADENVVAAKTVDEVWSEIVAGGGAGDPRLPIAEEMTLEDFLTKAGAVREEDVRVVQTGAAVGNASNVETSTGNNHNSNSNIQLFGGNGVMMVEAVGGRGRGKKRAVEEAPLDKATQQKQRRMIKNRESAARSRERKQAYTVELESLVTQLEEEHVKLLREEAELNRERFQQLMDNLIPVVDKRRPPRGLRRIRSVQW